METLNAPTINAQMLIRRPVEEVFEAFVDPEITTKFWFTKSSGKLEPGKKVRWDWEMFGVGTEVNVKAIENNSRIRIEWDDPPCPVEWQFEPRGDQATLVKISNSGFRGSDEEVAAQAIDSKGGFTIHSVSWTEGVAGTRRCSESRDRPVSGWMPTVMNPHNVASSRSKHAKR